MGLHTGQAVGDGLLLGLLEGESVVPRARKHVRDGAQQKDFLFGKIAFLDRLDVQGAQQLIGVSHRQSDGRSSFREDRMKARSSRVANDYHLSGAPHFAD